MDNNVSKIAANANFYVNSNQVKEDKAQKKEDAKPQAGNEKVDKKDPDAIMDAMQLSAMQNKAVAFGKFVNPKDYLSADRIKDIEASMSAFESASENAKAMMDTEFAGVSAYNNLSEADKLALAAMTRNI